jgi:hypothetical protein
MEVNCQFEDPTVLLLRDNLKYLMDRRLGGPHRRSARYVEENISHRREPKWYLPARSPSLCPLSYPACFLKQHTSIPTLVHSVVDTAQVVSRLRHSPVFVKLCQGTPVGGRPAQL